MVVRLEGCPVAGVRGRTQLEEVRDWDCMVGAVILAWAVPKVIGSSRTGN